MPAACWNCGAPPQCPTCGSTERRKGNKGCAECHRRANRKHGPRQPAAPKPPREPRDFEITPAMRAYLQAFDAWLTGQGTHQARHQALQRLRGDV